MSFLFGLPFSSKHTSPSPQETPPATKLSLPVALKNSSMAQEALHPQGPKSPNSQNTASQTASAIRHQSVIPSKLRAPYSSDERSIYGYGKVDFTLGNLCQFIEDNQGGLRTALIISIQLYREPGKIAHRFVILHLGRPGDRDLWMRLDRRSARGVSWMRFFSRSGSTQANDSVSRFFLDAACIQY
ncbi:hypothetical protein DL93DRAFT_244911 [Clavulina sp. PMI_390]|nr:hypothetical protein DL93DRAFT_244911 [Clavulina sp. PMI_390]